MVSTARFLITIILIAAPACLAQIGAEEKEKKPIANEPKEKKEEKKEPQGMQYRLVGPFRGGRSLTASGVAGDPLTYYFGSTGGGVWKSTDGAMTWLPVFDKEDVSAIGSLAVAPSDPNVIYVGTGEACIRGNISHGNGIYGTVD